MIEPPLDGVRVVAVEQYGAGPWATLQLAALGADVIKIEDPQSDGDVGRYVVPYQDGEDSLFFESFNGGKRSVALDLRHAQSRDVFDDLLRRSDVLLSNVRGDHVARLRLRYQDVCHVHPGLVCCSITGFGRTGPRAHQGAYDYSVQGFSGWMSLTGQPDTPPTRTGLSLVDVSTGYVAALCISAMLVRRAATGLGGDADVSLFDTALAMDMYVATWVLSKGFNPPRTFDSAHPSLVPFQTFATENGEIVVCCPKESLFRKLVQALGLPEMLDDPRFASFAGRADHREACIEKIATRLRTETTETWLARLEAANVPCGPVNDVASAFADQQAIARGAASEYRHPTLGTVRVPRPAVRADATRSLGRAPRMGEHTVEVMKTVCGYDDARIASLTSAGVLGDPDARPQT